MTDLRHSGATVTGRVVDSVTGAHIREVTVEDGGVLPLGKHEAFISDIPTIPRLVQSPARRPGIDEAEIAKRFTHHTPGPEQANTHGAVREAFKVFATTLAEWLPESREKSLAFTELEASSFWAHAAVAREGK